MQQSGVHLIVEGETPPMSKRVSQFEYERRRKGFSLTAARQKIRHACYVDFIKVNQST